VFSCFLPKNPANFRVAAGTAKFISTTCQAGEWSLGEPAAAIRPQITPALTNPRLGDDAPTNPAALAGIIWR